MRQFFYDLDDAAFTDAGGERLARCVPELFYQEHAEWKIALRDGTNAPADLSGVAVWGAAVDCDFSTSSAPMCRTLPEGITADTETGAVTVSLDCATQEFFAAVNGNPSRQAWFELYGLDENGKRVIYFCIEIRARMIVDPDPELSPETPDTLATKTFVSAYVRQSGALTSGAAFTTTVGGYTVALTSGGGLAVSGSGASVVLSGGQIAADVSDGGRFVISSGGAMLQGAENESQERPSITLGTESVDIYDGLGGELTMGNYGMTFIGAEGVKVNEGGILVNSRPVAAQLVTSTSPLTTDVIPVLSGGTSYVYTSAMYELEVASVVKTTENSFIHFTLDSATATVPVVISGVSYLNSATFEGGKEYLVGFFDGMAVVNEVTQ